MIPDWHPRAFFGLSCHNQHRRQPTLWVFVYRKGETLYSLYSDYYIIIVEGSARAMIKAVWKANNLGIMSEQGGKLSSLHCIAPLSNFDPIYPKMTLFHG
jgi:hypothetical protein